MRHALAAVVLPFMAWLGALQATTTTGSIENTARFIGIAGVLGTLTVLIYRLGVWRQEMENTRNNIGAEVKAYNEQAITNFDRLERRLDAIEHMVEMIGEFRMDAIRMQAKTDRRLVRLERYHESPT